MTSLFGHFLPKNDQMTQNNALYSNKQNVPIASTSEDTCHRGENSVDNDESYGVLLTQNIVFFREHIND